MSLKSASVVMVAVVLLPMLLGNDGCGGSGQSNREKAEKARASTMERAQSAVPVPKIENFINRKAVAEYMKRMDDPSKTFYVYLLSMTGDVIGYYVTRTHPISICSLMTPPDQLHDDMDWGTTQAAPTLNGLYANGADGCDHYYAFTADSDTMIEFSQDFFISDQPLSLEADQLVK